MEKKVIPWTKTEDFEFIDGEILLAINKGYFCLPTIVRAFGNGKVEEIYGKHKIYKETDFEYYAAITTP